MHTIIIFYRESRYLLFLTENYVALDILKHYLGNTNLAEGHHEEMEPYILFGSSFPKDKEYTQVIILLEAMNNSMDEIHNTSI